MIYKVPSRPFPDEILRMLANPPDPRAYYRRKVGGFILEPLISIEKQALLRKAVKLIGWKPEDVNLPSIRPIIPNLDSLKPNYLIEIRRHLREERTLDGLAMIEAKLREAQEIEENIASRASLASNSKSTKY